MPKSQLFSTNCSSTELQFPRSTALGLLAVIAACILVLSSLSTAQSAQQTSPAIAPDKLWMFAPLPAASVSQGNSTLKVILGRRLFYDTHLSVNNSLSCNSCHDLARYGVDPGRAVSTGHNGKQGSRNSPTVYNAGIEFAQFWDGRAATLQEQASGPMMNPVEMGMPDPDAVLAVLRTNLSYLQMFREAYPASKDPVTMENATNAIAVFEAGLLTPSRWDNYLRGDLQALSAGEKDGLRVFLENGCAACHSGAGMGGNSYQKLGAVIDWPDQKSDLGRFTVTRQPRDTLVFKVPMLRNVAETGPWFHNGQVTTLEEAVRLMSVHQTGHKLSDSEIRLVVSFLNSLTGPLPKEYIQAAELASSTKRQ